MEIGDRRETGMQGMMVLQTSVSHTRLVLQNPYVCLVDRKRAGAILPGSMPWMTCVNGAES